MLYDVILMLPEVKNNPELQNRIQEKVNEIHSMLKDLGKENP